MLTKNEVAKAFESQKLSPGQSACVQKITLAVKDAALEAMDLCPSNADRTAGMRLLLQAKQTLVQSITHGVSPEQALDKGAKNEQEKVFEESQTTGYKNRVQVVESENEKLREAITKLEGQVEKFTQAFVVLEKENEELKNKLGKTGGPGAPKG